MKPNNMVQSKSHGKERDMGMRQRALQKGSNMVVKKPQNRVVSGGMGQSILPKMGWELKNILGIKMIKIRLLFGC